jgi:arylsulfatase
VAQGGTAIGYALYLADGKLHFIVRSSAGIGTASTVRIVEGAHTAEARLDPNGVLTLKLDGQIAGTASTRGAMAAMPVDGLDVGTDTGGAVGPYRPPNAFTGSIQSVIIELDEP